MNILFYYPFNRRTIPIDVPLLALKERGHTIILLTFSPHGSLHEFYESHGIQTYSHETLPGVQGKIQLVSKLIRFCKEKKIDVIHSHLQQANLITVIAGLFLKNTRIALFRHHCKFHFLLKEKTLQPPKKEVLADWITNRLAKKIIVPSSGVKNAMVRHEKTPESKVEIIPYIYDFEQMANIEVKAVEEIRSSFTSELRVIMVSRLTPFKRHLEGIKAVEKMIQDGHSVTLLIMDDGPEIGKLTKYVAHNNLENHIHFLGFRTNILDFISASDIILHPSLTDASNSAIKECGLFGKVALVCDEVGDFNDYIDHEKNGFLLDPNNFIDEAYAIMKELYSKPEQRMILGENLRQSVLERFSISKETIDAYERL